MIFRCFRRRSFQNVHEPLWTVYNYFYPVAIEVTSLLLSLAWRLRLDPIVGSNAAKPTPILCKPTARFPSQRCLIRAHVHCTVPIKISNYPLSIFFLAPSLVHDQLLTNFVPHYSTIITRRSRHTVTDDIHCGLNASFIKTDLNNIENIKNK